jgi:hypothetical protein
MSTRKRKPTRRDLLIVIGRLQDKLGRISSAMNDRNPNREAEVHGAVQEGMDLCIEARSHDDSIRGRLGPWGNEPPRRGYI